MQAICHVTGTFDVGSFLHQTLRFSLSLSLSLSLSHTHTHTHTNRTSEGEGRYVQDGVRKHSTELAQWVMGDRASVYVCG